MMNRNYTIDILKKENERVRLAGWIAARRDHGKLIFLDLRDTKGIVQLVITPSATQAYSIAEQIRDEWVLIVEGEVKARPENMKNPELATGTHEVSVEKIEVISEAQTLPFSLQSNGYDIAEDLRLQYRYLDLRRPRLKEMLRLRDEYKAKTIEFLRSRGFIHIETPLLTKSTPEGARDFLVPSRHYPGSFYALPQSPQQYKQLLMVAGVEKYFQFARCFRDEDLRQDRLLEFEQLDIEMSFVNEVDVMNLVEELVIYISETVFQKTIQEKPFPRISYAEVMQKYKTDRPDFRKNSNDPQTLAYLWVTDFPMFERLETGALTTAHHPFTAIQQNDITKLDNPKQLFDIRARQYDLVLNGHEVFGGSIRTHQSEILSKVFRVLGHTQKDIQKKFGHLLEAFRYGVPPHGGIAASERWLMALLGEQSIREVVPFPTTGTGKTSVMEAPDTVDATQLKELGLEIKKKKMIRKHK